MLTLQCAAGAGRSKPTEGGDCRGTAALAEFKSECSSGGEEREGEGGQG